MKNPMPMKVDSPVSLKQRYDASKKLIDEKNFNEAIAGFKKIILDSSEKNKDLSIVYYWLGYAQYSLAKKNKKIDLLTEAFDNFYRAETNMLERRPKIVSAAKNKKIIANIQECLVNCKKLNAELKRLGLVINQFTDAKKIIPKILEAPSLKVNSPSAEAENPYALMCLQNEYGVYRRMNEDSKFTHVGAKFINSFVSILIFTAQNDFFFACCDKENYTDDILKELSNFKEIKSFSVILIGCQPDIYKKNETSQHILKIVESLVKCAKELQITFTVVGQKLHKEYLIGSGVLEVLALYYDFFRNAEILHRYLFHKKLNVQNIAKNLSIDGIMEDLRATLAEIHEPIREGRNEDYAGENKHFIDALEQAKKVIIDGGDAKELNQLLKNSNFSSDCARFEQRLIKIFSVGILEIFLETNRNFYLYRGIENFLISLKDFSLTPIPDYFIIQNQDLRLINSGYEDKMVQVFDQNGPTIACKLSSGISHLAEINLTSYPRRFESSWETLLKSLQEAHKMPLLLYLQDQYTLKTETKLAILSDVKSKPTISADAKKYEECKKLLNEKRFNQAIQELKELIKDCLTKGKVNSIFSFRYMLSYAQYHFAKNNKDVDLLEEATLNLTAINEEMLVQKEKAGLSKNQMTIFDKLPKLQKDIQKLKSELKPVPFKVGASSF